MPLSDPSDWHRVLALAHAEDLTPAIAFALDRGRLPAAPADVAGAAGRAWRQAQARHAVMTREIAHVLRALDAAGVPAIALKGVVLAETLYPHPALRPFNDLDVLVAPADRARADAAVRALGYAPFAGESRWRFDVAFATAAAYDGPAGARVDLHWSLVGDPVHLRAGLEEEAAVWQRAVPAVVAGVPTRVLAWDDVFLSLAAHLAVHHALGGLRWYADLARLIDAHAAHLDWRAMAARADRWRLRRAIAAAVERLDTVFGVPTPSFGRARGPRAALAALATRRSGVAARAGLDYVLPLLLADRARDAAAALARLVLPGDAWLRARYGEQESAAGRYVAHGRRLAGIAATACRAVALR